MNQDEHTMHAAKALYDIACDMSLDQPTQVVAKMQVFLNQMLDAECLTSNPAGKVAGYTPQPDAKVEQVNTFKFWEERILRSIDRAEVACEEDAKLWLDEQHRLRDAARERGETVPIDWNSPKPPYDQNLLRQARETLTIGFMLLNRAVFQPTRIRLPEDGE